MPGLPQRNIAEDVRLAGAQQLASEVSLPRG